MRVFLLLVFLISLTAEAQFTSETVKQIDKIENNSAANITLDPTSQVDIPYLNAGELVIDDGTGLQSLANGLEGQLLSITGGVLQYIDLPLSSPLTNKGDLYTYDTDQQRLALGIQSQLLSVDTAEPTGLKWIDPPTSAGGGINFIADGNFEASTYNPISNPVITPTYPLFVAGDELASDSNKVYWQGDFTIGFATNFYIRDTIARTGLQGEQGLFGVWIANNAADTTKLTLCLRTDDAAFSGACDERLTIENLKNDGEFHYYEIPFVFGAASVEYEIFHPAITADITVKLDQVFVGVAADVTKNINSVTDWVDEGEISISATTTAPTKGTTLIDKVFSRRVGDSVEYSMTYSQNVAGSAGSGVYLINLPNGLQINTSKVVASTTTNISTTASPVGTAQISSGSVNTIGHATVYPYDANSVFLIIGAAMSDAGGGQSASALEPWGSATNMTLGATTNVFKINFKVPIEGYTSGLNGIVQNIGLYNNEKILAADVTTTGDVLGLRFDDLTIGKRYRLSGTIFHVLGSSQAIYTNIENGSNIVGTFNNDDNGLASGRTYSLPVNLTFTATDAILDFNIIGISGTLRGDSTKSETFLQLIEEPLSEAIVGTFQSINSTDLIQIEAISNAGQSITASTTPIPFTEVKDVQGMWDGDEFIPTRNTSVLFTGAVFFAVAQTDSQVYVYDDLNNIIKFCGYVNASSRVVPFSCEVDVVLGRRYAIRLNKTVNLSVSTTLHNLYIQELPDNEAIVKNLYADNVTECETKFLQANFTISGIMTDLDFDGLIIGKKYSLNLQARLVSGSTGYKVYNNSGIAGTVLANMSNSAGVSHLSTDVFIADNTSITITNENSNDTFGDGTKVSTWAQLCKLPDTTIVN